ncbi:neutral protease-like [Venturia nashicola]|uniref:Neutral protease-like n=1 Tax=Venturia nashicola TaxID=86259 RepID=A0A4Z1PVG3_9PEZI|nr:neutral protease-like [Venturia nashicola]
MVSLFCFALFASSCFSNSIFPLLSRSTAESLLAVQLYHTDGSAIKATISNRGNTDLRILKPGSISDANSFSKFQVTHDGIPVPFHGMIPNFVTNLKWTSEHFFTIPAGQTTESPIDLSKTYDLTSGGKYLCAEYPAQAITYTIRPTCQIALCPLYWKLQNKSEDCMSDGMKGGFEQTGVVNSGADALQHPRPTRLQPSTDDLAYDFDDTINDEYATAGTSIQNAQSHALFAKGTS